MKTWIIAGGSALAALLVVVIVLLVILVNQNAAASERERYDRARQTCLAEVGEPTTDNLDEFAACADRLLGP